MKTANVQQGSQFLIVDCPIEQSSSVDLLVFACDAVVDVGNKMTNLGDDASKHRWTEKKTDRQTAGRLFPLFSLGECH